MAGRGGAGLAQRTPPSGFIAAEAVYASCWCTCCVCFLLVYLMRAGTAHSLAPHPTLYSPCAGSLNDVLKRARSSPLLAAQLDWPRRLNMALDAAKGGLQGSCRCLHLAVVPAAVLFSSLLLVKLPDWFAKRSAYAGMLYLHSCAPPIIHRDLKSANLLVDKHWRVRTASVHPACLAAL